MIRASHKQPGFLAALLQRQPSPSEADIRRHMQPNLCRCGTHMRILRAVARAAKNGKSET